MKSKKVMWVRRELKKRLKGVKSRNERTGIFREVWKDAEAKFKC